MNRLEGKVAIITGGAGGIASVTAERFVQEGARVVIADLFEDRARKVAAELGKSAVALHYDAGDATSVETAIDETMRAFGRIDILFNNAAATDMAIMSRDTTVTDMPLDVWETTLRVNLGGYLLSCKYAIPHMIDGGGGSIVNISSGGGLAGDLGMTAYGTSKAAVIMLSQYVAVQYGRKGVRSNVIAPGMIKTEATAKLPEALKAVVARHSLTGRLGEPADIAALAAFLAADESSHITGQTICCDGGHLAHQPHFADMMAAMQSGD